MIIDTLDNLKKYIPLHPGFAKVEDFLSHTDLTNLDVGRYEIDGDKLFLNVDHYETKESKKVEFHKKYIDIQIVVSGKEQIGWTPINKIKEITIPYNEKKDIGFGLGETDKLIASNGLFFIFFPEDAHQPGLAYKQPSWIKKLVFKIKL